MVICPVAVWCSPPSCERLFRPLRVSDEGVTGEGGSLIFYSGRAMEIAGHSGAGANERVATVGQDGTCLR